MDKGVVPGASAIADQPDLHDLHKLLAEEGPDDKCPAAGVELSTGRVRIRPVALTGGNAMKVSIEYCGE